MSDSPQPKIVRYLETALGRALGSMTGRTFAVAFDTIQTNPPWLDDVITWEQAFSVPEGPSLWIAAGRDLWEAVGRATLEAAGIDEVADEDCRSTWHEILNQTVGAIASAMTADQAREVTAAGGSEVASGPAGIAWMTFSVKDGNQTWFLKAGWTRELAGSGEIVLTEISDTPDRERSVSKTFDLLLEVPLPVAVSFGRTSLKIREVLKLNTGSIVELDRFVSDPVEVIVNDCVIARGEVVVVDGNYGVRISQLASREDRLRSGMAEAGYKGGRA